MSLAEPELFADESPCVQSQRVIYTPSAFARSTLLYLQEAGTLTAVKPHSSSRSGLRSYLCFIVLSGSGTLDYEGEVYRLQAGDAVFIDCRKNYEHSTYDDLWSLQWCHFFGVQMQTIYEKYISRGGRPVFRPQNCAALKDNLSRLRAIADSADYIRDMRINEELSALLTKLMESSWNPENTFTAKKKVELSRVKNYLDEHYAEKMTLDELAAKFYINKFYMSKIFRETYGTTIIAYLEQLRITKAKNLLRFSDMTVDEIAYRVGLKDANYFSRLFKKVEGMTPSQYRRLW